MSQTYSFFSKRKLRGGHLLGKVSRPFRQVQTTKKVITHTTDSMASAAIMGIIAITAIMTIKTIWIITVMTVSISHMRNHKL